MAKHEPKPLPVSKLDPLPQATIFAWLDDAVAAGLRVQLSWGMEAAFAAPHKLLVTAWCAPNATCNLDPLVWQKLTSGCPNAVVALSTLIRSLPALPEKENHAEKGYES